MTPLTKAIALALRSAHEMGQRSRTPTVSFWNVTIGRRRHDPAGRDRRWRSVHVERGGLREIDLHGSERADDGVDRNANDGAGRERCRCQERIWKISISRCWRQPTALVPR